MVPIWVALMLSLAISALLGLLYWRETHWAERYDSLQDEYIETLEEYRELRQHATRHRD